MTSAAFDVVIIGSGAGGGTVAQALAPLAAAGRKVLVLEQGARFDDAEFSGRELEMAPALYEDGGGFLTADGAMTLAFGRAYGGSTVVYTGTSLTAPARVIRAWDVPGLTADELVGRSRRYAEQNRVQLLPEALINDNNRLFREGAARAGFHAEQFPLNLAGCRGSSLCNLGCPNLAKQGTHRVQLPEAERRGVQVATRAEVLRIAERRVYVRVHAKQSDERGRPSEWAPGDYTIDTPLVIVAGGAIGSSALLLRSCFCARLSLLGAGFTCNPTCTTTP